MKNKREQFPNPVLANDRDDYIESCHFNTILDKSLVRIDNEHIHIPVSYELSCNGLQSLIESGDAEVIVKIKSSGTSYCELFKFQPHDHEVTIDIHKFAVVAKIDLECVIIAARDISQFCCRGEFNELYFGSETFEIRKGDLLASGETLLISLDDSELEKPVTSIFKIRKNHDDKAESDIIPDYENDKIEIRLKPELFDLYLHLKDSNNSTIRDFVIGVLVYPVLVEAVGYVLQILQNNSKVSEENDYREKRWFTIIKEKSKMRGIDFDDNQNSATEIANKILGNIVANALKSFYDAGIENDDENESIGDEDQ